MTNITEDFILQILKEVEDPSQSKDIVSLGLISDITIKDTNVAVTMEVPVHRGASMEPIRKLAQQKLLKIDNVTSATVVVTAHEKKQAKSSVETEEKKIEEVLESNVKRFIAVGSGKGGVGKSTVSTGLALALAQQGLKVGILDIDITGPNVPKMMGLDGRRLHVESGRIHPAQGHLGVKVISMAFLLDNEDTPVVWRGPIKLGAIQQFIGDVEWGNLDYLIIDFPPGTSDEPLTVAQSLPNIDGTVIVTTPQDVALLDSRKSITFSESLKVPVLGVVENMSGYTINGKAAPNTEVQIAGPAGKTLKATTNDDGEFAITIDEEAAYSALQEQESCTRNLVH